MSRLSCLLLLFTVGGCAKYAPESLSAPVRYAPVVGLPALCTSFVPDAGRLPKREADAWRAVRAALEESDPEKAAELVEPLGDHPARQSVQLLRSVVESGGVESAPELSAFADAHPDDACIQQFAGSSLVSLDAVRAQELINRAYTLDPDAPDVALVHAVFALPTDREAAHTTLAALSDRFPAHAATQVLAARAALSAGELDSAAQLFERAVEAGVDDALEPLFHLRRMTGQLDPYLRQAADESQPIEPVEFGDDPVAAMGDWLGLKEDTQRVQATLKTSLGEVHCTLYHQQAPITVINFVALARGQRSWTDPTSGDATQRPLYDDTVFHRVIPEFMIQGGDPLGTGEGFPGYRFRDELHPDLRFDRPGRLAMANSGPDTNGSQFFITEVPTPHLDGLHTIFGQCDDMDVVEKIARTPSELDTPETPVSIDSIAITTIPCETCTQ